MAYKFRLGTDILGSGAVLDTAQGDITLGASQVESQDVRALEATVKLKGTQKPTKSITYNNLPAGGNTIALRYNSVNYVVTITAGAGTDDTSIADGSATLFLGNSANADVFYTKVKDLFNAADVPDMSCAIQNGGDGNNAGTITWSGEVPGVAHDAWDAANNALPAQGAASSSVAAGATRFLKFSNAGIVEEDAAAMRSSLGLGNAAERTIGIGNGNVLAANNNVSNDDFLRIDGTSVEGRSAAEVLSDIGAQPADAQLTDIAGLTPTDGNFIVGDGSNFILESGATARASLGLGSAAVKTIGIANGNVLEIDGAAGLANDDFIRLHGSNNTVIGRTAAEVLSDIAALPLAGGTMGGAIAMGTNKITGLGTPTASADAATKAYVDGAIQGLSVKDSVRVASVGNVNISNELENGDTFDGITLATGDRVLLKNQSTASQNGVYIVAASGAASRAADFDAASEIDKAPFFFVEEGTHADKGFVLSTDGTINVGSTALTFSQFSGAGQITDGEGILKNGDTLSVHLHELTAVQIASGDFVAIVDSTDNTTKKESIDDIATLFAGNGLSASSAVMAVDLNELSAASVSVANDSIAIIDADDNGTKKESIADLVAQMAGSGLAANNGVLSSAGSAVQNHGNADVAALSVGFNYGDTNTTQLRTWRLPQSPSVGDIVYVKAPEVVHADGLRITYHASSTSHRIDGQEHITILSGFGAVNLIYVDTNLWRIF